MLDQDEELKHKMLDDLRAQIGHLSQADAVNVVAGHINLAPDLWLSSDPAGEAKMSCQQMDDGQGIVLHLEGGDTGAWAALGMKLPIEELKQAHYLGLLIELRGIDVVSATPTLRYYFPESMVDVPASTPLIMAGGPREHLSHIPLDLKQLERASGCELNLFFHGDSFVAEVSKIEPLLFL